MAIDTAARRSRRALLAGALGGAGAALIAAIGHPLPAAATDDDPVLVGHSFTATRTTKITNSSSNLSVITAASTNGVGIRGSSNSSFGGSFTSETSAAVVALSTHNTALFGRSGVAPFPNSLDKTGVYGFANQDRTSVGARGDSPAGAGVYGYSGAHGQDVAVPAGRGVFGYVSGDRDTNGVEGRAEDGTGVRGRTATGAGVIGSVDGALSIRAGNRIGVIGFGPTGVLGQSAAAADNRAGVVGVGDGVGVFGRRGFGGLSPTSADLIGVLGVGNDDAAVGVQGACDSGIGVRGDSSSGIGMRGHSSTGSGVFGSSDTGVAIDALIAGDSSAGIAVRGRTEGTGIGVLGITDDSDATAIAVKGTGATGVLGTTSTGIGVHGIATAGTAFAGVFDGKVSFSRFVDVSEIATPAAPAANSARLFVRDDGSGKTQLCVRFNTGAVLVLATQA